MQRNIITALIALALLLSSCRSPEPAQETVQAAESPAAAVSLTAEPSPSRIPPSASPTASPTAPPTATWTPSPSPTPTGGAGAPRLAFLLRNADGSAGLYLGTAGETEAQQAAEFSLGEVWMGFQFVRWSPDGRSILLVAGQQVYLLEMPGAEPTLLEAFPEGLWIQDLSWSPGSRYAAVQTERSLILFDLESGKRHELNRSEVVAWEADESRLYVQRDLVAGKLAVVDPLSGEQEPYLGLPYLKIFQLTGQNVHLEALLPALDAAVMEYEDGNYYLFPGLSLWGDKNKWTDEELQAWLDSKQLLIELYPEGSPTGSGSSDRALVDLLPSPDGRSLLVYGIDASGYGSGRCVDERSFTYVLPLDRLPLKLHPQTLKNGQRGLGWSPDGRAYLVLDRSCGLQVVEAEGGAIHSYPAPETFLIEYSNTQVGNLGFYWDPASGAPLAGGRVSSPTPTHAPIPTSETRTDLEPYGKFEPPGLDRSRWELWVSSEAFEVDTSSGVLRLRTPEQEDGSQEARLTVKHGPGGDWSALEARLNLESTILPNPQSLVSFSLTLRAELPDGAWWTSCEITQSYSREQPSLFCQVFRSIEGEDLRFVYNLPWKEQNEIALNRWKTVRLELDRDTGGVSYYLDGVLVDFYAPPEADELKKASLHFTLSLLASSARARAAVEAVRVGR